MCKIVTWLDYNFSSEGDMFSRFGLWALKPVLEWSPGTYYSDHATKVMRCSQSSPSRVKLNLCQFAMIRSWNPWQVKKNVAFTWMTDFSEIDRDYKFFIMLNECINMNKASLVHQCKASRVYAVLCKNWKNELSTSMPSESCLCCSL